MNPGDILTHAEMCQIEGQMLQRGMTFRPPPFHGIILMSQRPNSPYSDSMLDDGALVYEGHDEPRSPANPIPKQTDQPRTRASGRLTENGLFADWTDGFTKGEHPPALFRVYEKLMNGMWSYRGFYLLQDYRYEFSGGRYVFKFVLVPTSEDQKTPAPEQVPPSDPRKIPTWVKQAVYKRDKGRCVSCGATADLHFDHDLPFSLGGSGLTPANVRLLCRPCNLAKGAKIQ